MRPFTIAGLQLPLRPGDNVELIAAEVLRVKRLYPFVDMMVTGELTLFGVDIRLAQQPGSAAELRMREVARQAGVWLVPGSLFEIQPDGHIHNTALVINPDGEVVLKYRKMYPFLPYEMGVTGGRECGVFEVPGVCRIGVSICYDIWFPETIRQMTWMGAEVILHPTLTYTIDRDVEVAMARSTAAQHQCYVVDVNAVDMGGGRSGVYGPGGEILHWSGTGRDVFPVELDIDHVRRVRERGWHGLAQALKSYRDADIRYPVYTEGAPSSPHFQALGPMHYHHANTNKRQGE